MQKAIKNTLTFVFAALAIVACGTKATAPTSGNKQPAPTVDRTFQRQYMGDVLLSPSMEEQLIDAGLYTPDNCVQLVDWVRGTERLSKMEFTGWGGCGSNSIAPPESVKFSVDLRRTGPGNYEIYDAPSSTVYGKVDFGGMKYNLLSACQFGADTAYAHICDIQIENSSYKSLERFLFDD